MHADGDCPGSHTCVRSTLLRPPTSHVLALNLGGALRRAPPLLELGLSVKLKVFLQAEHASFDGRAEEQGGFTSPPLTAEILPL